MHDAKNTPTTEQLRIAMEKAKAEHTAALCTFVEARDDMEEAEDAMLAATEAYMAGLKKERDHPHA